MGTGFKSNYTPKSETKKGRMYTEWPDLEKKLYKDMTEDEKSFIGKTFSDAKVRMEHYNKVGDEKNYNLWWHIFMQMGVLHDIHGETSALDPYRKLHIEEGFYPKMDSTNYDRDISDLRMLGIEDRETILRDFDLTELKNEPLPSMKIRRVDDKVIDHLKTID
tara:strand:+ start:559 stop:1047 length:489 start_codon:yes stop_codon:yes gene_type:complete